ncbi:MAG: hypothetical protein V3R64_06945 [Sphingomonadales bacterium]
MPQLDFDTYLPQLFWLAVTFVFLYLMLARKALPRVGEVLEERQNRIDSDLEQAENFRKESEALEADYERLSVEARAKALAHLKAEREKVQVILGEKQAAMTTNLEERLGEAEGRISEAKTQALKSVEDIATEACVLVVAKVSGMNLTKTTAKKAVLSRIGAK